MSLAGFFRPATRMHKALRLNELAQTPGGKVLLWGCASALLWLMTDSLSVAVLFALFLWKPEQRTVILCLGSLWVGYELLAPIGGLSIATLGIAFSALALGLYAAFLAARNFEHLPKVAQRHPQLILHALLWCALLSLWWALPRDPPSRLHAAALTPVLAFLVWRIGYLFLAARRGSLKGARFRDHLFYLLPAFGGTNVPFGKGHDTLAKVRADSPDAIAACQLSGLYLLLLACSWKVARKFIDSIVYGRNNDGLGRALSEFLPAQDFALMPLAGLMQQGTQAPLSLAMAWPSLFLELIHHTLSIAIIGHIIVGSLRLFGYNALRNTDKPLLAQTIIEFWNRFYYYFKELLVEFFFYPTYLRLFKPHPRLRIFAAVMASAGFGNLYYHVLRDLPRLQELGVDGKLDWLASRGFYSLLLALGIFVSMLREKSRRGCQQASHHPLVRQLTIARRIACVWLFFALIHIWSISASTLSFAQRGEFFLALFGLPSVF